MSLHVTSAASNAPLLLLMTPQVGQYASPVVACMSMNTIHGVGQGSVFIATENEIQISPTNPCQFRLPT